MPLSEADRLPAPPPVVFSAANRQGPSEQFRYWDRDHDGKLSREEVPELVRGVFDQVDMDHDGAISPQEDRSYRQRFQDSRGQAGQQSNRSSGQPGQRPAGPND
jgi:Ca2+-binding EF-hand superfamily protein